VRLLASPTSQIGVIGSSSPSKTRDPPPTPGSGSLSLCLPDPLSHLDSLGQIPLGVDLGDVGLGMTEDDLSCFQAELTADLGGCRVPEGV
jgi:hypothetical protein